MSLQQDTFYILQRLAELYPKVIFSHPARVHPFTREVTSSIVSAQSENFGEASLRLSLRIYRESRAYRRAVAEGRRYVNLFGETGELPSTKEQKEAGEWLQQWSVDNCELLLRNQELNRSVKINILHLLDNDLREQKALASFLARSPNQAKAYETKKEMLRIASLLYEADPNPAREKNRNYIEFTCSISGSVALLLEGAFDQSVSCSKRALDLSRSFSNQASLFPNYFFDQRDLASFDMQVFAIQNFKAGNFQVAADWFDKWLVINQHRLDIGNAHYDANLVNFSICLMLAHILEKKKTGPSWSKIDGLLSSKVKRITRPTRALLNRLEAARLFSSQSFASNVYLSGLLTDLLSPLLASIRDDWRFLCPSVPLLTPEERSAGIQEAIRLPSMFDILDRLERGGSHWQLELQQLLHNALILKADFETQFVSAMTVQTNVVPKAPFELEQASDRQLVDYVRTLVQSRRQSATSHYEEAIDHWWSARNSAMRGTCEDAVRETRQFFAVLRGLPHILFVTECELEIGGTELGARKRYRIGLDRCWNYPQTKLLLEYGRPVSVNKYVYMRSRWNMSLKPHFRADRRLEPIFTSRVPEWMSLFQKWADGDGPVSRDIFLRWVGQIEPQWRPVALRLLSRFTYVSENAVRTGWRRLYQDQIPADAKTSTTVFLALGSSAKSGTHQLYYLNKALADLEENEKSFSSDAFRTANEEISSHSTISSVVFVDDFIGTGIQAVRFLKRAFDRYPWLQEKRIYLATLFGISSGVESVSQFVADKGGTVYCDRIFRPEDSAFSWESGGWDSQLDLQGAREWCAQRGQQLLEAYGDTDMDSERDNLGWMGSASLLAFHYNTPNNTLPLFWAGGVLSGKEWAPLFERR